MKRISDLELPFLPFEAVSFRENPFLPFQLARQQHPWLAKCSFAYVITSYQAVRELMAYDDQMCVGYGRAVDYLGAGGTPWGEFIKHAIQNQVGPLHKRLRDSVAPAFTPRAANENRAVMREQMTRLLDEWGPREAFEFGDFASHYPVSVMCRIIGASPDLVPGLRSSLEILGLGGSFEPDYLPQFQQAYGVVDSFVRELVMDRRAGVNTADQPDLLDRLLEINDGGGVSDDELFNLLVFLFTAGYDTSKNVLSLALYLLIDRPEYYERCAQDIEFSRKVITETLRYHGVASSPRVLLEDIQLRDVYIPKETMLFIPWSTVNRDPHSFKNPDEFDPDRERDSHIIPFGLGPHMCLGQFIARAQLEEGLHLMAQRIKRPRRAGENGWREFVGVWGIRGFPIEFDFHTQAGLAKA
jgi:cytochrome P450